MSAKVEVRNLRKRYGPVEAVRGVDFDINDGEIFGLLGPNGAGKTTTVSLAVGLLEPDEGTVTIAGLGPPSSPAVRSRLGLAPQALALYDGLSGDENVAFFGSVYGLAGARLAERVSAAIDLVGLADRRRDRVSTYSGGMKRRLNLAVALVHDPELILLDEPTAGVDPQSRNLIFENVRHLREAGKTIVYTTHYMEEAERLCDRVAIIDHGRLLALGTVAELLAAHGGRPVLVAEAGGEEIRVEAEDPLAELNRLAAGRPVSAFRVERASLEQVFLHLTGRQLRD
jgi:ABC-2 type transport system ATP-binding protein